MTPPTRQPGNTPPTRGPARLASVTYATLADWTGLSLATVRTYASRGAFDRHDLESILAWANARRAAQGLPPIGQPPSPPSPSPEDHDP